MPRARYLATLLASTLLWVVVSAQSATSQLPAEDVRARLRAIATAFGTPISTEDAALMIAALEHSSAQVRVDAVEFLEAKLSPLLVMKFPDVYRSDAGRLAAAEPGVWKQLDSTDPRMRQFAVRGAALLRASRSFVLSNDPRNWFSYDCGLDLAQRFERMFASEPDAVRTEIVKWLTGVGVDVAEPTRRIVHGLLMSALKDPSMGVVTAALWDVTRRRLARSLEESVRLLAHKDYQVRMVAAQAVASFGRDARPYLPDLRRAADAETHDITRKTILGSITVIER